MHLRRELRDLRKSTHDDRCRDQSLLSSESLKKFVNKKVPTGISFLRDTYLVGLVEGLASTMRLIRCGTTFAVWGKIASFDQGSFPGLCQNSDPSTTVESANDLVHELLATKEEVTRPGHYFRSTSKFIETEGVGSGPSVQNRVTEIQQRLAEVDSRAGVTMASSVPLVRTPARFLQILQSSNRTMSSSKEFAIGSDLHHLAVSAKAAAEASEKMPRNLETSLDDTERWIEVRERVRGQARDISDVLRRLGQ
ncbi:hypothetical protein BJ742DRAFT_735952 [Cladochytrium replicatum]|nr:hypothetical protein BJ742DRAFT_735952 [Cladochytrium replicatum]